MAWDGIERRLNTSPFNGSDRRRTVREHYPENLARLKDEQMLEEVRKLRRERFEYWEASEYLE